MGRNKDIVNILHECRKREEARLKRISDILEDIRYDDEKLKIKDINKYLFDSEKDYLYAKLLHVYTNEDHDADSDADSVDISGLSDYFPSELVYMNGMYVFTLPAMYSFKRKDKVIATGKYMRYLILRLIKNTKLRISAMKKPVIFFEHHVCNNTGYEMSHLADADNMDAKSCQDAMQGFFFNDDNVLSLTTIHRGVPDKIAFTRIYVMEEETLVENAESLLK